MGRLGFPNTRLVKFKYSQVVALDPNGLGYAYHTFRANSCRDPDYTGIGHQPMGWDQWGYFYNHYTVVASKMVARFSRDSTTAASDQYMIGVELSRDLGLSSTTWSDIREASNRSGSRYKTITGIIGDGPARAVVSKYNAKQWWNLSNVRDNPEVGASWTLDPASEAFFKVWVMQTVTTGGADPWQCTVDIYYTVVLSEPEVLATS